MTFEQFVATRDFAEPELNGDQEKIVYYDGTLEILKNGDGFLLVIENVEYPYPMLEPLERILFDWATRQDYFN